ncbi:MULTISPECIES: hypothetical protein [Acidobacteriaceae]|uniref:hypothetical protein n=1 Tax=Acidobacteriaceae TaxID=204434 RepID=UPI001008F280|nr:MULTISPECIES: hypothetical protein [Acidobacteriaceae]
MTPTALAKDALDPGRRSSFPESSLVETVDNKSETLAEILSRKRRDHRFFLVLATLAAITIFSGFSATYYLKPLRGLVPRPASSQLPMVIHLHGAVFTLYVLFYLFQTALISRGQRALHMTLGWVSIALIPAMVVLGTMAAFRGASVGHMQNWPDLESAAMVNVMSVFVFAVIARRYLGAKKARSPQTAHVSLLHDASAARPCSSDTGIAPGTCGSGCCHLRLHSRRISL